MFYTWHLISISDWNQLNQILWIGIIDDQIPWDKPDQWQFHWIRIHWFGLFWQRFYISSLGFSLQFYFLPNFNNINFNVDIFSCDSIRYVHSRRIYIPVPFQKKIWCSSKSRFILSWKFLISSSVVWEIIPKICLLLTRSTM